MTKNNIKMVLFLSLITAMVLPFSMAEIADADETKQIPKPTKSEEDMAKKQHIKDLFLEKKELIDASKPLKHKYENEGKDSLKKDELDRLKEIDERIKSINVEFETINNEAVELYSMTDSEKQTFSSQKSIAVESGIPFHSIGTDRKTGALVIGFANQTVADAHIPQLDEILSVPYYIEIGEADVDLDCSSLKSDCDPIMGGIEIGTQKSASHWTKCSISVPVERNVFWWTESGFVTAAHCFNNVNGNDAKQPASGPKIGEVTKTQNSGECDCAFVKITSDEDTFFGYWSSDESHKYFIAKLDPLVGHYVIMVGKTSGVQIGQIVQNDYDANGIENMLKIDHPMGIGDSGGTVTDMLTQSMYHGLIKGGNLSDYTSVIPWSHIDSALDLQ